MMNKGKKWVLAVLLCGVVAMAATGCDQLKKDDETETETETEAPTETETETEAPTETETETEAPTETETETEAAPTGLTTDTTLEEEQASLVNYDTPQIMYALDEVNVRVDPNADADVFTSYDLGDEVTVIGETTNWYRVDMSDYDFDSAGYAFKAFIGAAPDSEPAAASVTVSSTASEEGSDETSVEGGDQGTGEESTGEESYDAAEAAPAATTDTAAVDAEYGVETYSDPYTIVATAGANMRSEPSQDGEIVSTIASDTEVTAVGYTDRWYKINYNGMTGYVNRNLFSAE